MAFSGLSSNTLFTPNLIGEDISTLMATLTPVEAPLLDWLGDASVFATSTKHEFVQDYLRPNYIIASTAVASATAATYFQVNGLGTALTVGTLLENESAAPEIMQVSTILGPNTIGVTRNYDGAATGSLVAGGQFFVRAPAGIEGQDHDGSHSARLGLRRANTVGYFNIPISASGTQLALNTLGGDSYANARAKIFTEIPFRLETEIIRGVLNATNSLGTTSATRTMQGIRGQLTAINSTITATSFAANPHLYIGNVMEQAFVNGAATTEEWAILAGRTWFRDISNLNDTKVQDSNQSEAYKRVIRRYEGPFGAMSVFLSRALPATELLVVSRQRVKVVPLNGRNFTYVETAKVGDNVKGFVAGEYTVEVHHPDAMARLRV